MSKSPANAGDDGDIQRSNRIGNKKGKKAVDLTEHLLNDKDLQTLHSTSYDPLKPATSRGLTATEAAQRLATNGPNVLSQKKGVHPIILYFECLANLFNLLLLIAGVLTYVLYGIDPVGNYLNVYVGAILIGVALLNAFIEFYQMRKSASILSSFLTMVPSQCHVYRDGKMSDIPAADLVQGDVVFVRQGDKVPADIRIIHSGDAKVDNSSLTGESEPQDRTPENSQKNPLEATNLAFNSTLLVAGECYGVVIRTGDATVLGQIAGLTQGEKKRISPLTKEIDDFVWIIGGIAFTTAIIFFAITMARTHSVNVSFNFAIGVLTAWVPQGLPATVSMLLTIAAKRMANRNVLVKDLRGVETLGAITLLATDKTGTLTRNRMSVTTMWTSGKLITADPHQKVFETGEHPLDKNLSGVQELLHISAMCTRARFERTDVPINEREVKGDATEIGLFTYAAQQLPSMDQLGEKYPKVMEIPFNSENKWNLTIHDMRHASGSHTLFVKGAPERILKMCSTILKDGASKPLDKKEEEDFLATYEWMAGKGRRVLAFAQLQLPEDQFPKGFGFDKKNMNFPTVGLCFVGLVSLEDPPKHGVREAIGHCRGAGIKVMMVTGDHPLTAEAIGRKINLMLLPTKELYAKQNKRPIESVQESEIHAIVIHGERIATLTDAEWDNIFSKEEIIFARTSPKNKLEIVRRAQGLGHIVGVTGDGVNDSPALKKADLGISMNISGSDVSKEAAAMILLDDNFASIVNGIVEGRLIFANLKKCVQYVVTHIVPEVIPFLLYAVVPLPNMLGTLQILVIDLGFELFCALSFAWEPVESATGLMKQPPRQPVTEETIARRRMYAQEDRDHGIVDPEAEETTEAVSGLARVRSAVKAPFSGFFWKRKFRKNEGEVLVDMNVLSWAYLEAGLLETFGCLLAFFLVLWAAESPTSGRKFRISPYDSYVIQNGGGFAAGAADYTTGTGNVLNAADQVEALAQGQSAYYWNVMLCQMFNLFACKTRYRMPFGRYQFKNPKTFACVLCGGIFTTIIVYAPPFNIAFATSYHMLPLYWLPGFLGGFLIIMYSALRKLILRKYFPVLWNKDIDGLIMHPTRWSTKA
ncbi:hypothetical protein HKX48_002007 [Thoreauomyces humboldtii]|nr:hypothetical protein HKX48_002007 [Thoreauomyces humboldtii]